MTHLESNYLNNKPRHLVKEGDSAFQVITHSQFSDMETSAVQTMFRHGHILVTDCPHSTLSFNAAGLSTLTDRASCALIQGHTLMLLAP